MAALSLLGPLLAALLCAGVARGASVGTPAAGGTAPSGASEGTEGAAPVPVLPAPEEGTAGEAEEEGAVSTTAAPEPNMVLSSEGVTLRAHAAPLEGQALRLTGTAPVEEAGERVAVERYLPAKETWMIAAHGGIGSTGIINMRWKPAVTGQVTLRVAVLSAGETSYLAGAGRRSRASARPTAVATPTAPPTSGAATVTVYKPAIATFFGPGLYGRTTACGQVLTPGVIGVANRTLPCGTLVDVSYEGRHLTVPVLDRGPFGDMAEWDLTAGAAEALGFEGMGRIGTLAVGTTANSPSLGLPPAPEATPEAALTGGAAAAA